MKKRIIGQSIACVIASAISASAMAEENRVIVTANQMEQNLNDTLTDVEVIERSDIERLQPQSFIDLLVNISGIDSVRKGGQGQDTSVFSRGTNSNQLLILIDGVKVGSATLGIKSLANIAISQIERIEIVKGPRAALWGSDAIGGVIQIFTRRYQNGEHRVAVTLGSDATREVDASIGFGNESFSNTVTYSHQETDGFDARIDAETDKDGHKNDSLAIRGDYKINQDHVIDWIAQVDEGETEFDTSWGGNILSVNNYHWNLRYSYQSDGWQNQFSVNSSRDQSFTYGNGVDKADADIFETRRMQYNFLTKNQLSDELAVSGGLNLLQDNVEKSTTGYAESERDTKSAFVSANYIGSAWLAEAALRYDDVEKISDETSANISLGYRPSDHSQLSVNFGQGFKAPTFNDLYYPFGGNPDLKFETSENREIVYKGFYDIGNLVLSYYDSNIDNLIQWIPDSNGIWAPQNVGKADISGIDASFGWDYGNVSHKLAASYVDPVDANTGTQLILRAKQRFSYDVAYSGNNFDWFVQIQRVGKRPDNNYQTFMPTQLDSYTQVNLGTSYRFKNQWQLKLKISDAFNEAAVQASGYNPEGRQFYLSLVHSNLF